MDIVLPPDFKEFLNLLKSKKHPVFIDWLRKKHAKAGPYNASSKIREFLSGGQADQPWQKKCLMPIRIFPRW